MITVQSYVWKRSAENPDASFGNINAQNTAVPEIIKERAF
jgi:hypothetical protein